MGKKEKNLEQYSILMSYLQYENSTFWVRSNFFLLANTALLGFIITSLPRELPPKNWSEILIPAVGCISGLILTILWLFALKSGEWWINRWHFLLVEIEPFAFGETKVLRGLKTLDSKRKPKFGARQITYIVCFLFVVLWILSICYCIFGVTLKVLK
jgi:hypothetical protein